ncbi:protein teflon [Drosophila eugracilis]|uniref:protein teflon n=1 Tax=Drosophila eugracilis TaxID=29029 RepID=UPI0007E7C83D|nr:protein teflon [Drosophila eugracilis]
MSTFLEMLSGDQNVDLKKCGDVVISPSDNMIALYCHFCSDIYTNLPEFLRHLQWAHVDVLHFTKEPNVYSVEELLIDREVSEENAQTAKDNNRSGDFREHAESVEPKTKKDIKDTSQENCETKYKLAKTNDFTGFKSIIFEANDFKENEIINMETFTVKGSRNIVKNKKTLQICDLKSHTIARKSRKHMSIVKSRILNSIETKELQIKSVIPNIIPHITEPLQLDNIPAHSYQTPPKCFSRAPILSVRKSSLTKAQGPLGSPSSPEIITALSQVKLLDFKPKTISPSREIHNFYVSNMANKKPTLKIKEVKSLPNLNVKPKVLYELNNRSESSSNTSSSPKKTQTNKFLINHVLEEKAKQKKLELSQNQKLIKDTSKSLKTIQFKENIHVGQQMEEKCKKSNENDVQKLCYDIPDSNPIVTNNTKHEIINALVTKEGQIIPKKNTTAKLDSCSLLQNVGLSAIINSTFEDKLVFEEVLQLRQKASQFSKIYKHYHCIWNYRAMNPPAEPQLISLMISSLTSEVNMVMRCNLTESDIKRIVNLIFVWHKNMTDQEDVEKPSLSTSAQYYLNLFTFLPVSFVFFCANCNDYFAVEKTYKQHLMSHQFNDVFAS